jgi:hypothetical protein
MKKLNNLILYKDDRYMINLAKDHWQALVVQVCRFGPKSIVDSKGHIAEENHPYVAWSKGIGTTDHRSAMYPRDPVEFKKEVMAVIVEAKQKLSTLQLLDSMMDGIFQDHLPSVKQYNDLQPTNAEIQVMNDALPSGK